MRILAGDSPSRSTRVSALAGLAGLALVVAPGLGAGSTALGLAVMIAATVSWALGSFLSGRFGLPGNPFVAAVYEMAAGGLFLVLAAVAFDEPSQLDGSSFTTASVSAWLYLVVAGSLVGFSAYAWLLRVAPISLVVTHQYVNPLSRSRSACSSSASARARGRSPERSSSSRRCTRRSGPSRKKRRCERQRQRGRSGRLQGFHRARSPR